MVRVTFLPRCAVFDWSLRMWNDLLSYGLFGWVFDDVLPSHPV